ncbi:MAG TPA: hypothetical protein VFI99_15035, partial [Nocardioides sp.]|nr:hypothetical protein [Nocardioides sp.]
ERDAEGGSAARDRELSARDRDRAAGDRSDLRDAYHRALRRQRTNPDPKPEKSVAQGDTHPPPED